MNFDLLLCDIDAPIAVVTINRPDKLNALNAQVMDELDACFVELARNDEVRAIIITGAGDKAFVAGADIGQFSGMTHSDAEAFAKRGQSVFSRIESSGKPVIAAVNGYALGGGCELALACHIRIAASGASFGQPEVTLGITPGYGGTQRLPRIVGRGIAFEMILTGDPVSAERAERIGLVNAVVPADELLTEARRIAGRIAQRGPVAVTLSARAVLAADLKLEQGLFVEAELFGRSFATDDVKEGVAAFLEKRRPDFKGR